MDKASPSERAKKIVFLVALAPAKRVGEIHALSNEVGNIEDWFSVLLHALDSLVAKTQDPSLQDPRFGPFEIPALPRDKKGKRSVLCPVRALKLYHRGIKAQRGNCKNLFLHLFKHGKSATKKDLQMDQRCHIRSL